jgi:hypothetical protein
MSNATTRAAIATAANTVDGVTVHAVKPASPGPGDGWVRWRGAERADGFAFMNTWQLVVIVAPDDAKSDEQTDRLGYALAEALEPVIFIDSLEAVAIATSAGQLRAVEIIGRSE